MSNSIWKTPDQKPERFRTVIFQSIELEEPELGHWDGQTICPHNEFESLDMSQITRWCYLDCLIAQADKAERLQKAVDYALQVLDGVIEIGGIDMEIMKIKQLIKENQ